MLASAVIDTARVILKDTSDARWSDATLLEYVGEAEYIIFRIRPDLFLGAGDAMSSPVAPTDVIDVLTLDESSKQAMVSYVVAQALLEDSDDSLNTERADTFLRDFYRIMRG